MSQELKELVVATRNPGKFREIAAYFADLPLTLKSLADEPRVGEIREDGRTFVENALKKARAVWKITGGFVLADDSGIVCDDLAGRPGVESARFAGVQATDEENNRQLLEELDAIHDPSRTIVEETCEGMITLKPAGSGGFGYDPYFYLPEKQCTMAELPLPVKNRISHRGKALQKMRDFLKKPL
ncbi:MAG: non-canonical purine NTP pyrophosphatase [Deltaproteobacteria bacterium]|nr:non-canonical purine NTP pyrophosphatase [Deltaproteobacteria bacterium]